jgi:hypothetical protein
VRGGFAKGQWAEEGGSFEAGFSLPERARGAKNCRIRNGAGASFHAGLGEEPGEVAGVVEGPVGVVGVSGWRWFSRSQAVMACLRCELLRTARRVVAGPSIEPGAVGTTTTCPMRSSTG